MIICVPNVLSAQELATIGGELERASFVDGSTTAGWSAREVKRNQQLDFSSADHTRLATMVREAFMRNAMLQAATLPSNLTQVLFNRYASGMHYGPHVDAAVMGPMENAVRTDIAITIFLSDPKSYSGGELTVLSNGLGYEFKLEAGSAIAYPANTLHHVKPVTHGARNAAIIWVQSQVRDPAKREILWDLANAKHQVFTREGKSPTFDAVSKSHANLMRMWAET
ncbi:Fe2+-dependent dioxygenase [Dyella sp. A6]|uniref:Fe2+-dependent dioxygenase n=1 Tax=Dyella aluminiiresistens TaxID=3069105 RepID=UPI002E769761|nr:Fe2+-dependent dioxygenase [Dyella sp. A6]